MNLFATAINAVLLHTGSLLGAMYRNSYRAKGWNGRQVAEKQLLRILRSSRNTELGKKYGFQNIKSAEDYQKALPLTTYDDYAAYIERTIKHGEQRLITGRRITYFAESSGTTGKTKYIPQTMPSLFPYFKFICVAANDLVKSLKSRGVSSATARGVFMTEISERPACEKLQGETKEKIPVGLVSSYATSGMKVLLPVFTVLPMMVYGNSEISDMKYFKARCNLQYPDLRFFGGTYMSFLTDLMTYIRENHEMLIRDIETGAIDPSVVVSDQMRKKLEKKLRPDPGRAAELRDIFQTASEEQLVSRIWREMSFVCAVGTCDFAPFTRRMQAMCKEDVHFNNMVYCASEGLMGMAMETGTSQYLLLPDTGFYEFIPIPEECETEPERPLLMHELEIGKHYEIVVTNLAGLYRYRIHDVIRVTGYEGEIPYLEFAYRSTFYTDMCATHITGEQTALAVSAAEQAAGVRIEEYSLYGNAEHVKPRLELFLEPERPLTARELECMTEAFQNKMMEVGYDYGAYYRMGVMDMPVLRPVAKGAYLRWRDIRIAAGASGNQLKALRVIGNQQDYDYFLSQEEHR